MMVVVVVAAVTSAENTLTINRFKRKLEQN
jgi:hypothetical protein